MENISDGQSEQFGRLLSWPRIERTLSGKSSGKLQPNGSSNGWRGRLSDSIVGAFGAPESGAGGRGSMSSSPAYIKAELHCHLGYPFLHGASDPEELVSEAARLGLNVLGLVDCDGFHGIARFAEAAVEVSIATIIGAELGSPQRPLIVLGRGSEGYWRLSHTLCDAHMSAGEKSVVRYPSLPELGEVVGGLWQAFASVSWVGDLEMLIAAFGVENVAFEYHVSPTAQATDDAEEISTAAVKYDLREVASFAVTAASPVVNRLVGTKQAFAMREDLDGSESRLGPVGGAWLRSWEELSAATRYLGAQVVQIAQDIVGECVFTSDLTVSELPRWEVLMGRDEDSWLREIARAGVRRRYGPVDGVGDGFVQVWAWTQLESKLTVIRELGLPGYFPIVHDICELCRRTGILAQGCGSAANSMVCFALRVTNIDPISAGLLFERLLSPERDGLPDIDVDTESGRREEVIQYVYEKYGRDNAAQVANVITYRRRSALRDAAWVLGYSPGVIDTWVRDREACPTELVRQLMEQFRGQSRRLDIYPGGMVICDQPIADAVPVEWARMEGRSVVQWNKDDCAVVGLVRLDLLGLGMLGTAYHCIDLVYKQYGRQVNLWEIDAAEPEVYKMSARADVVDVPQVESRAQLATLP